MGIYYAIRANVNTGIVTIIWRGSIFVTALFDYIIYGQRLKYYHFIGLFACVGCTVLTGVSKMVYNDDEQVLVYKPIPVWIPILISSC